MGTRRRVAVVITEVVKVKVMGMVMMAAMVTLVAGRWLRRRCGQSVVLARV